MTVLKHEAKKIDNISKVKFPISVFRTRLCNNSSVKEKYTLRLQKNLEVTGFSGMYHSFEITLISDSVLSNGFKCNWVEMSSKCNLWQFTWSEKGHRNNAQKK